MPWLWVLIGLVLLAAVLYWQLVIAEGSYLGPRVVALLYDWAAPAYERIKGFNTETEQWFLGLPLAMALERIPAPFVLDVGTGTGRLPRALLFQPGFRGHVVGVDRSRRMLAQAAQLVCPQAHRITLIWQDARTLPFPDNTFDAVTALEMLEFTPDPRAVLSEMVRVLRPGGVLLVTNRVGREALLLPGRAFPRPKFITLLSELPLEHIQTQYWQVDYDLVWARKKGRPVGGGVRPLAEVLRCPDCGQTGMEKVPQAYRCTRCGRVCLVAPDGVVEMQK
ncbi:MAG: class I SAM-dependent methyltransferase [Anaerolineae bacterium]|nr:class I SAM-dependent methyltransferase [Anaerolineae bacterium]MDW8067442.1 class I SAM-dependent methyltransferase [Anaerolineae bacterium]